MSEKLRFFNYSTQKNKEPLLSLNVLRLTDIL
jgi:hypothetical protein